MEAKLFIPEIFVFKLLLLLLLIFLFILLELWLSKLFSLILVGIEFVFKLLQDIEKLRPLSVSPLVFLRLQYSKFNLLFENFLFLSKIIIFLSLLKLLFLILVLILRITFDISDLFELFLYIFEFTVASRLEILIVLLALL